MNHINFSIHDFVLIYLVFTVVNREEDDVVVADFSFEDTCLKNEVKNTEMKLLSRAYDLADSKHFDFEFDIITTIRSIHPL